MAPESMTQSPAALRDPLQDRTMEVETPEHVSIEYPLAGLGSRFTALLADGLIIAILLFAVPLLLLILALLLKISFSGLAAEGVIVPVIVLYFFVVFWGYFFFFEAFRDGQTIGKRW